MLSLSILSGLPLLEAIVPTPEFGILAPVLLVFAASILCVLVEAFVPRSYRLATQLVISLIAIGVAFGLALYNWNQGETLIAGVGSIALDGPTYFAWLALLVFGFLAALLFGERRANGGSTAFAAMGAAAPDSRMESEAEAIKREHTEVYPLMLFALAGMMLMVSANDLLMMFVGLEVFSLPLYLLVGLARRRRYLSQEASLKYFMLGALSSALFIFGVALLYGYSGSFDLAAIDAMIISGLQNKSLLLAGMTLTGVGLLFKIGAFPFHAWMPDVYTGAPTPVTAFMAICTKLTAVFALLRLFYVALGAMRWNWQIVFSIVAVLTMLFGAVLTVTQQNVKRMLAWSSITHAGFILVGVTGAVTTANGFPEGQIGSVSSISFYLAAYGLATMGIFALLQLVRKGGIEAYKLSSWAGIGRKNPVFGVAVSIMLLSFAGIPLTAGFIGKLEVFLTAWRGGYGWLVAVAILASVIAAFAYFRLIIVMFFQESEKNVEVVPASPALWTVVMVAIVGTILFGIVPGILTDFAVETAGFLR